MYDLIICLEQQFLEEIVARFCSLLLLVNRSAKGLIRKEKGEKEITFCKVLRNKQKTQKRTLRVNFRSELSLKIVKANGPRYRLSIFWLNKEFVLPSKFISVYFFICHEQHGRVAYLQCALNIPI